VTATRLTLLERVRDPADREAWEQFFELYAPLIEGYARASGLGRADVEEVRDQCLEVLTRKLPTFEYRRASGSFQGWLHRIVRGKVVDLLRARKVRKHESVDLAGVPDGQSALDAHWERQWRSEHLRYALSSVREGESEERFRVFELLLVEELSVAEVCARTDLQASQVYKIKAGVLRKVRAVLERLGTGAEGSA
jgi:RNA polymerase sigma-70 factor (ECF subfamily)